MRVVALNRLDLRVVGIFIIIFNKLVLGFSIEMRNIFNDGF